MLKDCSSLSSLPDISKCKTYNVNNIGNTFCGYKLLSSLTDISERNIYNDTNMRSMLYECCSLSV